MTSPQENTPKPEIDSQQTRIVVGSSGRGGTLAEYLGAGRKLHFVSPDHIMTDAELDALELAGNYELAQILRADFEVPKFIDVSSPEQCSKSAIARAGYKCLRALASDIINGPNVKNRIVIARDTVQVAVSPERIILQDRPGASIVSQKAAAQELAESQLAGIFTAECTLVQSDSKRSRATLEYLRSHLLRPHTLYSGEILSNNFAADAVNFRLIDPTSIRHLPDECFTNLPGGLNYEHPLVQANLAWSNQGTRFFDDWQLHTSVPFNCLNAVEQNRIQMVRRGVVPGISTRMEANQRQIAEIPMFEQAVADYINSNGQIS